MDFGLGTGMHAKGPQNAIKIYRFAWIRELRLLLKMKVCTFVAVSCDLALTFNFGALVGSSTWDRSWRYCSFWIPDLYGRAFRRS